MKWRLFFLENCTVKKDWMECFQCNFSPYSTWLKSRAKVLGMLFWHQNLTKHFYWRFCKPALQIQHVSQYYDFSVMIVSGDRSRNSDLLTLSFVWQCDRIFSVACLNTSVGSPDNLNLVFVININGNSYNELADAAWKCVIKVDVLLVANDKKESTITSEIVLWNITKHK